MFNRCNLARDIFNSQNYVIYFILSTPTSKDTRAQGNTPTKYGVNPQLAQIDPKIYQIREGPFFGIIGFRNFCKLCALSKISIQASTGQPANWRCIIKMALCKYWMPNYNNNELYKLFKSFLAFWLWFFLEYNLGENLRILCPLVL
jgi:hypothetical protein